MGCFAGCIFTDSDKRYTVRSKSFRADFFNPYPANVENMVRLLIMPADGRWDLTWRLKG